MFPVAAKAECGDANQISPIVAINNGTHLVLIARIIYEYSPYLPRICPSILFQAIEMLTDSGFGSSRPRRGIGYSVLT